MAVSCDICGKRLRTRYNMNIHMAVHTGTKAHACDVCHRRFTQRWNLVTHVSRVHAGHKPFTCADCGRSFGYKSHFKAHVRSHFLAQIHVPAGVKSRLALPHACRFCERSFETPWQLAQHETAHSGVKPFVCDSCGKAFASRRSVAKHIQNRCAGPNRTSGETGSTRRRRNAPIKDPTPCEVCGKAIARYSMNKHLNIHTRRRTYPCQFCGREFLEAGQRAVHERTHSGRKPHACELCEKAFAQRTNLVVHRRRHHGLHEGPPRNPRPLTEKRAHQASGEETVGIEQREVEKGEAVGHAFHQATREDGCSERIVLQLTGEEDAVLHDQSVWDQREPETTTRVEENQELDTRVDLDATEDKTSIGHEETYAGEASVEDSSHSNFLLFEEVSPLGNNAAPNTIREFVDLATQWITTRAEEQVQQQTKAEEPLEKAANWTSEAKKEVWEKLMSEIGEEPTVKKEVKRLLKSKVDGTMRLLRRLPQLPANSVVTRGKAGTLTWHCWGCTAHFPSRHLLMRHRLRHLPPQLRPHRCPLCARTFTQSGNLQYHMLVHRGEHRFTCEQCGALFRHKPHLETHLRQHEDGESAARFNCATCGKGASSRFHIIQHIRTHTRERPHQCQTCGKQFAASSTHERHMKTHTALREQCVVCGLTFADSSSMRRHQASHDARKGHVCVCGRSFTQLSSLRRHAPICSHAPTPAVKSLQCHACPKTFHDVAGLKRHANTHDVARCFPCAHCPMVLKTQETLKRHVRRQHQGMPSSRAN